MPNPYEGDARCIALYRELPPLIGDNIRLVTLHPGQREEIIRCDLTIEPFETAYQALSYTWAVDGMPSFYDIADAEEQEEEQENGDIPSNKYTYHHKPERNLAPDHAASTAHRQEETTIVANGREVPVTANLAQTLAYLREPACSLTLWIDYLCIDQNSKDDRTAQVQRMGEIYCRADSVIVWLGLETPDCGRAFNELRTLGQGQHIDQLYPSLKPREIHERLEPVLSLFERPYFARMWVVQEAALARRVEVRVGAYRETWEVFIRARDAVLKHVSCCKHILRDSKLAYSSRNITSIRNVIPDPSETWVGSLYTATRNFCHRDASDPRDRVFSLLGMLEMLNKDNAEKSMSAAKPVINIQADYNLSERDVFEQATLTIMEETNTLSILAYSGDFTHRPGFPSWISDLRYRHPDGKFLEDEYTAGGNIRKSAKKCSKDNLRTVGIPFDSVASVGPTLRYFADGMSPECIKATHTALTAWEDMNQSCTITPYKEIDAWDDALWQTLWRGWNQTSLRRLHPKDRSEYQQWRQWLELAARSSWRRNLAKVFENEKVRRHQLCTANEKKTFFITGAGYYGMAYPSAGPGDVVCILSGANVPFLLRQLEEVCGTCKQPCFRIVGYAYVHGIMNGEVFLDHKRGNLSSTGFCLK